MGTEVIDRPTDPESWLRRKSIVVHNDGTTRAVIDAGEYGVICTDEPAGHGGRGAGPSPLQTVLGALCGCESVTFCRTAAEYEFAYDGIEFEAAFAGVTVEMRWVRSPRSA